MNQPIYDLVSIGETMLRFSPKSPLRLEQSSELETHVGGSESNTLVGLSRLGLKSAWISRLPSHVLGQSIARNIAMHGVDTQHVVWSESDRLGLYFFEPASAPRSGEVIYDRKDSAFANFSADLLPVEPLQSTRWFHATGISLALGPRTHTMMDTARTIAKKSGSKVSFDFNYRSKLWDMESAREGTQSWVCESDIVFFAKRDATAWLGIPADSDDRRVVDELLTLRGGKATVITLGGRGAIGGEDDKTVYVRTLQLDGLDRSGGGVGRLGGGDAFSAGVLFGHLQGWSLEKSLRWGNAMAGIKYSIPGDLPVIQQSEVSRFVDQLEKLSDGADGEGSLKLGVNR